MPSSQLANSVTMDAKQSLQVQQSKSGTRRNKPLHQAYHVATVTPNSPPLTMPNSAPFLLPHYAYAILTDPDTGISKEYKHLIQVPITTD
jgi:hypothetical protein